MLTRTSTGSPTLRPFWLAALVLVLAAFVASLAPVERDVAAACTGISAVQVDCAEPVAADVEPEALAALPPHRVAALHLRPVLAITGDTQHLEPPPQRPPRQSA